MSGPHGDHAYRYQVEARRVQAEEHDLRIGSHRLVRVQFLQAFHGFQSERRGGIIEPQQVGRKIHDHQSMRRVILRHFGEEAGEERPDNA